LEAGGAKSAKLLALGMKLSDLIGKSE